MPRAIVILLLLLVIVGGGLFLLAGQAGEVPTRQIETEVDLTGNAA